METPMSTEVALLEAEQFDVDILPEGRTVRTKIENLETRMLELPQVECPIRERFAPGLYAREIVIPKGTLLTGKIHREDDISVMVSGDISVLTQGGMKRLQGYQFFVSQAGIKKLGYAWEDTVWITFHANPTDETDWEKLEPMLVTNEREDANVLDMDVIAQMISKGD
jgi:hypothetical protein